MRPSPVVATPVGDIVNFAVRYALGLMSACDRITEPKGAAYAHLSNAMARCTRD